MTKTKLLFTGLVPATLGGFGTYELLRGRGSGKGGLEGVTLNNENGVDDSQKDVIVDQDKSKDTDNGADTVTETKDNQNVDVVEPAAEEEPKQEEVVPPVAKPKPQTYLEFLRTKNKSIVPVDKDTPVTTIENILLHRMFPHYKKDFDFSANQMFQGSPKISFKGQEYKVGEKTTFILNKNSNEDVENVRKACIAALDQPKPDATNGQENPQLYRLKAWCTAPTVRDVLLRHKFKLAAETSDWKQILESEWIKEESNHNKQSFFSAEELSKLKGVGEEANKITVIKNRCNVALSQPFNRTNFPAPKELLTSLNKGNKADEFQEAALFCTIPTTAEEYVKTAMQGVVHDKLPDDAKDDYCYVDGKNNVADYSQIKTTDPMGGKTFWCAVRLIYHKQAEEKSKLPE